MGNIYNIPLNRQFLPEIAHFIKLLQKNGANLAEYRVYLPNKRSCRVLKDEILEVFSGQAFQMPCIKDISEEFLLDGDNFSLLITKVLQRNIKNVDIGTMHDLSKSLFSLVKNLFLHDVSHWQLSKLVPNHLMENWVHTVSIVGKCTENKDISEVLGSISHKFDTFVDRISNGYQKVISVGIGDSNNYTRRFLKAVKSSENGIIFLTGNELINSKNQDRNKKLLELFDENPDCQIIQNINTSEEFCNGCEKEFDECSMVLNEFSSLSEEALGVALIARKSLDDKKSVLVVTGDSNLSRKIKCELLRWNIVANDSYGVEFSKTKNGILVSLIMDAVNSELGTQDVLNVLKLNSVFTLAVQQLEFFFRKQNAVSRDFFDAFSLCHDMAFEKQKRTALAQFTECERSISDTLDNRNREDNAVDCKNDNKSIFADETFINFVKLFEKNAKKYGSPKEKCSFLDWLNIIENLMNMVIPDSFAQFEKIVSPFIKHSLSFDEMTFKEFSIFLKKHILSIKLRLPDSYTKNITILGFLEAQLLDADVVIVAGTNENSMIGRSQLDFWMSNSMLKALNIRTVEVKKDFIQCIFERLAHKSCVFITRSENVDGVQQQRYSYLDKLVKDQGMKLLRSEKLFEEQCRTVDAHVTKREGNTAGKCCNLSKGRKSCEANCKKDLLCDCPNICGNNSVVKFVRNMHESYKRDKIEFVAPSVELRHKPKRASVTDIELLCNNPYAFYAKKILKLRELNSIGMQTTARGNYVHKLMEIFVHHDDKNMDTLIDISKSVLKNMHLDELSFGMWFFRTNNIFSFIVENIDKNIKYVTEVSGKYSIKDSRGNDFSISCKVDRIDIFGDNRISIIDYKSGKIPTAKEVECGLKPQLPLEAIIAQGGGFDIGRKYVSSLKFWSIGKPKDGGEVCVLTNTEEETRELMEKTLSGLRKLIDAYNVSGIPYNVNIDSKYDRSYLHLARVKEWLYD